MKNKTTTTKENIPSWHFVDAANETLGRLASDISQKLIGKHKETFTYRINTGDKVVVTNASKILTTGKKGKDKIYHRYTGYPSGIKSETLEKLMIRRPTEALRRAVKGMLPKNKMQKERLKNLYIYEGSEHPHKAQMEKQNG